MSPRACLAAARTLRWLALALALLGLAGCAQLPRPGPEDAALPRWSGRLALRVDSQPPQAVSAAFDLRGSAERGELALLTPLGSTAAVLSWAPGLAVLREQGQPPQGFSSLETLVDHALGAPVPVAALFDWLHGTATSVAGWRVDLSRRAQGRLHARRDSPAPSAELRIVLDPP